MISYFYKQHPCSTHQKIEYTVEVFLGFPTAILCSPIKGLKNGNFFDRMLGNFMLTGYEKHVGWWLAELGWLVSLRAAGPKIPYNKNFQIRFLGGNRILRHTPPKFNIDPVKILVGKLLSYWEGI